MRDVSGTRARRRCGGRDGASAPARTGGAPPPPAGLVTARTVRFDGDWSPPAPNGSSTEPNRARVEARHGRGPAALRIVTPEDAPSWRWIRTSHGRPPSALTLLALEGVRERASVDPGRPVVGGAAINTVRVVAARPAQLVPGSTGGRRRRHVRFEVRGVGAEGQEYCRAATKANRLSPGSDRTTWQATCLPSSSRSSGVSTLQRATASGQRWWKVQPVGGLRRKRHLADDFDPLTPIGREQRRGRRHQRARVRMARPRVDRLLLPSSATPPKYITMTSSAMCSTTDKLCEMNT